MRHPPAQSADMPGQDSFLDIVANMVGILIILVMVVGVRAKGAAEALVEKPAVAAISAPPMDDKLEAAKSQAAALEDDVRAIDRQAKAIERERMIRDQERTAIATAIAMAKTELAQQRDALDAEGRRQYDTDVALAEAAAQLESLEQQRDAAASITPKSIKVQNLPTPISTTVHGREVHLQLRGGRVAYIPLEELLDKFQATARHRLWKLEDQAEMTDTIGPIGGFRLRYQLGRFDLSPEQQLQTGRVGSIVRLVRWELLPVSSQLGEPIDDALADGSRFRQVLSSLDRSATITLWTYPDSFDVFRRLKAELHARRLAAACRPLPEDQLIGGSPEGTRSSAQ